MPVGCVLRYYSCRLDVESQVFAGRVHALIIVANWEFLFPKKRLTANVPAALCGLKRVTPRIINATGLKGNRRKGSKRAGRPVPGMRSLSRSGARRPERLACHGNGSASALDQLRPRRLRRPFPARSRACAHDENGLRPSDENADRVLIHDIVAPIAVSVPTYAPVPPTNAAPDALLTGVAFPAQGLARHHLFPCVPILRLAPKRTDDRLAPPMSRCRKSVPACPFSSACSRPRLPPSPAY